MKIALIGYGKMGHMIEQIALERGHEIVGVIDPSIAVSHQPSAISFESEAFRSADVAIEFTTPSTAKDNILRAWAQGVPVVCGTTGWNVAFGNQVAQTDDNVVVKATDASALPKNWKFSGTPNKITVLDEKGKTMLIWSSNFSVGVNIFFELNKYLAEAMTHQPQYTPSITETHHIHKLDKPSGTAKTLAEGLRVTGDGLWDNVPIESIRESEVPGTHEVKWDSEEDTIVITHIAKGRRGFALGAVLAAEECTHSEGYLSR
jgi:4-hydroxy-tetrahydrodipicolinate reductase